MENSKSATESTEDQKTTSEGTTQNYYWYMVAGGVILVAVIAAYIINFNLFMDSKPGGSAEWGAFGDFVGGIANPLLGFVTIWLLVSSLRLQARELKESTEAVRQSAKELGMTREIHGNQKTLQLRDGVRPQIIDEYQKRIAGCELLLRHRIHRNSTLRNSINNNNNFRRELKATNIGVNEQELDYAEEQYNEKLDEYFSHIDSLVSCAAALIEISDTDIFIEPLVGEVDDLIIYLVQSDVISFQDADDRWYSEIEKAILKRQDTTTFPPLHVTDINLMEKIENRRKKHAEFAQWADSDEEY